MLWLQHAKGSRCTLLWSGFVVSYSTLVCCVVSYCSSLKSDLPSAHLTLSLPSFLPGKSGSLAFSRSQTPASHVKPHCGEHNQPNVFLVRWMCVAVTVPVDICIRCSLSLARFCSIPPSDSSILLSKIHQRGSVRVKYSIEASGAPGRHRALIYRHRFCATSQNGWSLGEL